MYTRCNVFNVWLIPYYKFNIGVDCLVCCAVHVSKLDSKTDVMLRSALDDDILEDEAVYKRIRLRQYIAQESKK